MSAPKDSERPRKAARSRAVKSEGVLSQLPRTRPQRSSPRRAAARQASALATAQEMARTQDVPATSQTNGRPPAQPRKAAKAAKPTKAAKAAPKQAAKRTAKSSAKPFLAAEPAPRQGFECEGERTSGSVHPPGGAELVASAAEIVGELAKAGILTGERLLKDVLSRLPLT
jgi:hypothetical protein